MEAEYEISSSILKEKIEVLDELNGEIRRPRGDGKSFLRSFIFSYLEHILNTQDKEKVEHVLKQCEKQQTTDNKKFEATGGSKD